MIGIKYIDRINDGTKVLVDSRLEMFNVFNHSYFCVCQMTQMFKIKCINIDKSMLEMKGRCISNVKNTIH